MNQTVRLVLYVVLTICTIVFGILFFGTYSKVMSTDQAPVQEQPAESEDPPEVARAPSQRVGKMMLHGFLGGLAFVGLALLLSRDIAKFLESRAEKFVVGDHGEGINDPDYEVAEQAWGRGEYLEAIQLMRDHHKKNPREIHACIRIAEIYEKDLGNHLAAALEYEEVIKHKLAPERWGWAAIHLANLYSGKLNKPDQAMDLLKRIVDDHPGTPAARKARERLVAQGIIDETPPQAPPEGEGGGLPPGFSRKK